MDNIREILQILPQTQCEECGYKGCRPYAEAIQNGESIDLCAPGGEAVYDKLIALTNRVGEREKVRARYISPQKATIDQSVCIGCTKCIKPCPTNAIVGYKKQNHFVIASDCTGCGLCIDYCPVDCIDIAPDKMSHAGALSLSQSYRELYEKKGVTQAGLEKRDKVDLLSDIQAIISGGQDE